MSYDQGNRDRYHEEGEYRSSEDYGYDDEGADDRERSRRGGGRYRDEVFSKRVPAGKRTYFFDVKSTRSGEDFFVTVTESKRIDDGRYEKHKIFLYKEDFGKFLAAMHEVVQHIKEECLPDYDFRDLPDLTLPPSREGMETAYSDDERDF